MRSLSVILSLSFYLSTLFCHAQWEWQNPLPQGNHLKDVHFVDSLKGWAAGYYGTILYTEDGGESWEIKNSGVTNELESIHMVNSLEGWAVGWNGTIIHTSDGGNTWTLQDCGFDFTIHSVFFTDNNKGWVVGGKILHTTDGGLTWEEQSCPVSDRLLLSVFFINNTTGWISGDWGLMLKTTNAGYTWIQQNTGYNDHYVNSVFFIDVNKGWAAANSLVLKTDDGGDHWTKVYTDQSLWQSVYFPDEFNGYVAGSYGMIAKTTDGGDTWTTQESNTDVTLYEVFFSGYDAGWIIGKGGKILHFDHQAGNWESQSTGEHFYI
ncbi:MAG: hypothetical protein IMY70_06310, partial [Bacteroidetes bacterium]|nr:hypothetical protein [Bacteroidota bacterium]